MKQLNQQVKPFWAKLTTWACRLIFGVLVALMSYVVTRQRYNYAHWVPHNSLKRLGLSYQNLLWIEQNGDYLLHFCGAFILTALLYGSKLTWFKQSPRRPIIFIIILCITAEGLQLLIGRAAQSSDLLLGILGSFMAYLVFTKNKKASN